MTNNKPYSNVLVALLKGIVYSNDKYWRDFDEDWWRKQVAQGRLYRSRIDLFLQYWLTMRVKDEIQLLESRLVPDIIA